MCYHDGSMITNVLMQMNPPEIFHPILIIMKTMHYGEHCIFDVRLALIPRFLVIREDAVSHKFTFV